MKSHSGKYASVAPVGDDIYPDRAAPVGGRIFTKPMLALLAVTGIAGLLIIRRFALGLGASTALTDGYPWGIWIAFDVVTGTAFGCGGFAMALLVYIMNKGQYHPLVRPAVVTSALGYSIAGLSVMLDLGRPWLAWKIPFFVHEWNGSSVLLEVALCIMAYAALQWIELMPAFLERAQESSIPALRKIGFTLRPVLERALLWLLALGILLPTMHQSSLGSLLLLAGPRLHPLWNTMVLPLLFLVSCIGMGFGAVVLEATLSSRLLGRRSETDMLAGVARAIVPIGAVFLLVRVTDLVVRGQLGALLALDVYSTMTLVELALFTLPLLLLASARGRRDPGNLLAAGLLFMLAGALYRFDVYLLAFQPGAHWHYFPSVSEILITAGLVTGEIAAYIILIKTIPILGSGQRAAAAH